MYTSISAKRSTERATRKVINFVFGFLRFWLPICMIPLNKTTTVAKNVAIIT